MESYKKKIAEEIIKIQPKISVLILSFNREFLLRNTLYSLLLHSKLPLEIFIIDNHSKDGSVEWLKLFESQHREINFIYLKENKGGEAFNEVISKTTGEYVLFSENDLEYLPNWDIEMLIPFYTWNHIGQISPFSPYPMEEIGEIWSKKDAEKLEKEDVIVYLAKSNLGTTNLVKKTNLEGILWKNYESNGLKFPADGIFSLELKQKNLISIWSENYRVINWGHNKRVFEKEKSYFIKNWETKSKLKIDGLNFVNLNKEVFNLEDALSIIDNLKIELGSIAQKIDSDWKEKEFEWTQQKKNFEQIQNSISYKLSRLITLPYRLLFQKLKK